MVFTLSVGHCFIIVLVFVDGMLCFCNDPPLRARLLKHLSFLFNVDDISEGYVPLYD